MLIVVKIGIDSYFQTHRGDSMFLLYFSHIFFLTELQFLIIICSGTIWINKKAEENEHTIPIPQISESTVFSQHLFGKFIHA